MMQSYTYGTTPEDVILSHLPHKYDMSLNREDMLAVLAALNYAPAAGELETPDGYELCERMSSLRTGILATLDIEEI
jgi:hypothetical protein